MSEKKDKENLVDWEFLDYAGRKPVHIIYSHQPRCSKCGDDLQLESVKPGWFPYIHVDLGLQCNTCKEYYLFGIPFSKDAGLALHVWDTNIVDAVAKFKQLGQRRCRFGHGDMLPTKIFGDWHTSNVDRLRYQWKCPTCYLTHHEWIDRDFPHGTADPLSEDEKETLMKRMKSLGYTE